MKQTQSLFEAAVSNDVQALKEILATGADINAQFQEEASTEYTRTIANIAWYGKKALGGTIGAGSSGIVGVGLLSTILSSGITLPLIGVAAIIAALGGGSSALIYRAGNDALAPKTYERNGWTALHFAAASGAFEAAEFLLKEGADPTRRAGSEQKTFIALAKELHWGDPISDNWSFATKCEKIVEYMSAERQKAVAMAEKLRASQTAHRQDRENSEQKLAEVGRRLANLEAQLRQKDHEITTCQRDITALTSERDALRRDKAAFEAIVHHALTTEEAEPYNENSAEILGQIGVFRTPTDDTANTSTATVSTQAYQP